MKMMASRREFIKLGGAAALGASIPLSIRSNPKDNEIVMAVTGRRPASSLRFVLSHEHILVDFIGADKVSKERYNSEEVYKVALPFLMDAKKHGCNTFVDCTPIYLGRDVKLLHRLSEASGLNIICPTGYYGARQEKIFPPHVYTETAEQLAARWISEWKDGIDGTTIRPGFIKCGVDNAPLSEAQRKVIEAAALTHLATGLTIGIHTGNGEAAKEEFSILNAKGVSPSAFIWIHAQNEEETQFHLDIVQRGSWISFDGVNKQSVQKHLELLKTMKQSGYLNSVLVSQDAGWYHVGEVNGGTYNDYNFIFTDFIPAMRSHGFTQKEIDQIFISNPAKAFSIRVRKL
jgi:predicted metal-dependent phosphotriesterase family hydrolase